MGRLRNAAARLPHLDELGIQGSLMFPTLASLLEERMRDDPDLAHAVVHSLNQWIHDEWTFNYHGRIFATPVITLPIVEKAVEELEWCLERGARCVLIRPAPAWGLRGPRSPGLPEFDPFWARVQEAGVLVGMHASDSGYADLVSIWEGRTEFLPFKPNPLRLLVTQNRAISDMMTAMVCHGALTRFPDLRIATIENGGTWVAPLVEKFEGIHKKMPQDFPEHPVEAFKRNVYVNPFWEDALEGLIEIMSPGPAAVRLRLSASRGLGRSPQLLRRPAPRRSRRPTRPRSWAATSRNCWRSDRWARLGGPDMTGPLEGVRVVEVRPRVSGWPR